MTDVNIITDTGVLGKASLVGTMLGSNIYAMRRNFVAVATDINSVDGKKDTSQAGISVERSHFFDEGVTDD